MKKLLLSFILMASSIGMVHAADPVLGIVCSYGDGQEAFFPLSDSPSVEYVTKDDVRHAVVMVGGVEKLSVALADGGTLTVTYDSRKLHDHDYATAWSYDETNHWHYCNGSGDCDAPKSSEGAHGYGTVATETSYYTCSVCQYQNTARKAEYEAAVKAAADKAAADAVSGKIKEIGTVEYNDYCYALIYLARAYYEKLTPEQKALITKEQYKVLTDAEETYARLKAEGDKAAADNVIALINAIGTVEYTTECKELIDIARDAYDDLIKDQKALISEEQYKVLTDAEAEYKRLEGVVTGIENTDAANNQKDGKYIQNGKVVIVKNGKQFTVQGTEIK